MFRFSTQLRSIMGVIVIVALIVWAKVCLHDRPVIQKQAAAYRSQAESHAQYAEVLGLLLEGLPDEERDPERLNEIRQHKDLAQKYLDASHAPGLPNDFAAQEVRLMGQVSTKDEASLQKIQRTLREKATQEDRSFETPHPSPGSPGFTQPRGKTMSTTVPPSGRHHIL